jgi:membrane associated rhomboid family serine protease
MQTCYRHPSVETGLSCSSCGKPICTDCMHPSHVGQRCPDCAKQKTKVQTPRSIANAAPQATYALIVVNVVAFFGQVLTAGQGFEVRAGRIYEEGVLVEPLVADGDLWRLASSGFLHEDPVHLLLNMVLLFFLGAMLEPMLGVGRFLAVYAASLFAGGLGVILEPQFSQTIGASGAVYGLLGAAFVVMRQSGVNPFQTWVGAILIINVLWTFARPGVSIGGHLGGLVGGALAALVVLYALEHRQRALALAGPLAVAVGSFVLAVALAQPF